MLGFLFFAISACSKKTTPNSNASTPDNLTERKKDKDGRKRREGPIQFAQLLERMDSNNDLKLSLNEVQGRLKDRFASIDQNSDGFINEQEFNSVPKPQRKGNIPSLKQ